MHVFSTVIMCGSSCDAARPLQELYGDDVGVGDGGQSCWLHPRLDQARGFPRCGGSCFRAERAESPQVAEGLPEIRQQLRARIAQEALNESENQVSRFFQEEPLTKN